MITNEEFLAIMKKASETDDFDGYMNLCLGTIYPYDLVFGKKGE